MDAFERITAESHVFWFPKSEFVIDDEVVTCIGIDLAALLQ